MDKEKVMDYFKKKFFNLVRLFTYFWVIISLFFKNLDYRLFFYILCSLFLIYDIWETWYILKKK
ncbi:Uncharacterised protein [Streptococcus acidominimus]|uniref:Uncharacterized protein n=1 Tax=Streptococcus acidominimus TaxID=1326 RepID=A0A239XIE5_STRAI|nr:Uncharacterised protein [Streptococcus acidominimus]